MELKDQSYTCVVGLEKTRDAEFFHDGSLRAGLKKRAVKGAGVMVFSQTFAYSVQMISTVILARLLTPDDFGLVAMVSVCSVLLMNFGVKFTEAILQEKEITHEKISSLFWVNIGISVLITVGFMACSPIIAWFFSEPRLRYITVVMAFPILLSGLSTQHIALLKRSMKFKQVAANDMVAAVVSVIIAIAMASAGWGYWAVVARQVTVLVAGTVGAWIMCSWRPGLPIGNSGIYSMVKFACNTYCNYCMTYFSRNLDKVLIGRLLGSQLLGHYDRAYQLSGAFPNQLVIPLTTVAVSTLSRLREDPEKYWRYFERMLSTIAFLGMGVSAVLTVIGKDLVVIVLGPQWGKAGDIFTAFAPGLGMALIYSTSVWLHLSLGRADRCFRWSIIGLLATIIAYIIGLRFGAFGVAVAYSASLYILAWPALSYAGGPLNFKLSSFVGITWKYMLAALIAGVSGWIVFYSSGWISSDLSKLSAVVRVPSVSIVCIFLYLAVVVVLHRGLRPIIELLEVAHDMLSRR